MAEKKASTRARGAKPRNAAASEEVAASTLNVGDKVFFPNSRHAQTIEEIVDDDSGENPVRRINAAEGTVSWLVSPETPIKKES